MVEHIITESMVCLLAAFCILFLTFCDIGKSFGLRGKLYGNMYCGACHNIYFHTTFRAIAHAIAHEPNLSPISQNVKTKQQAAGKQTMDSVKNIEYLHYILFTKKSLIYDIEVRINSKMNRVLDF